MSVAGALVDHLDTVVDLSEWEVALEIEPDAEVPMKLVQTVALIFFGHQVGAVEPGDPVIQVAQPRHNVGFAVVENR